MNLEALLINTYYGQNSVFRLSQEFHQFNYYRGDTIGRSTFPTTDLIIHDNVAFK